MLCLLGLGCASPGRETPDAARLFAESEHALLSAGHFRVDIWSHVGPEGHLDRHGFLAVDVSADKVRYLMSGNQAGRSFRSDGLRARIDDQKPDTVKTLPGLGAQAVRAFLRNGAYDGLDALVQPLRRGERPEEIEIRDFSLARLERMNERDYAVLRFAQA